MDLKQLAASKFSVEGYSLSKIRSAGRINSIIGRTNDGRADFRQEARTEPLIASFFWQILRSSSAYARVLQLTHASPIAIQQAETIIVAHGRDDKCRYDLVVLDPAYPKSEPTAVNLRPLDASVLLEGMERWRRETLAKLHSALESSKRFSDDLQRSIHMVSNLESSFPMEAMNATNFGIIVACQPILELSAVPSPKWEVVPTFGGVPVSTAGVVVKDMSGRVGVTVALHSLTATIPAVIPGTTTIEINVGSSRVTGRVQSIDSITDSAFVEISPPYPFPMKPGSKGPLRGVTPRVNEPVTFEGMSSGPSKATVVGMSPDLPLVLPYSQLKVFTTPVTSPGDSGAALLDGDDRILGFSFYRTGIGQQIEFSAWIWADSVYAAHNLI